MLAYTYRKQGEFALQNKPEPVLTHAGDAVVRVTMSSICTSDLHIKHGSVPRAIPGITVGHDGRRGRAGRFSSQNRQARRPCSRQRGDVLRTLLFLSARLCQQLHRSQRRLGTRLPD